jgi:hypothetical protein
MGKIKFRLAKPSDAKQMTDCHWTVRDRYTDGIFLSLGKSFLRAYYEIVLNDPNEIVVCAENENGEIVGFSSGSLDAESQVKTIKKQRATIIQAYPRLGVCRSSCFMNKFSSRTRTVCFIIAKKQSVPMERSQQHGKITTFF